MTTAERPDERLIRAAGVDLGMGEAMADALLQWNGWVLRRVESVHLLHGERGRRRNSIDCIPPPDPRLAYLAEERGATTINDVRGLIMVPLTMVEKAPMRDLDVLDGNGRTMPIVGRSEDAAAGLAVLVHLWRIAVGDVDDVVLGALQRVVEGAREESEVVADALIDHGRAAGAPVVDLREVPEVLGLLVKDFAANFLLIGLLPADRAGVRQVLKWSANWHITRSPMSVRERWAAAAGIEAVTLRIPTGGLTSTSSYHLEVHLPAELAAVQLALPPGDDPDGGMKVDGSGNPVAHVYGAYPEAPAEQEALLRFAVPWRGLRVQATFAAAFTAAVFLGGLSLPDALSTLLSAGGGAAGLLLAAPGALMAVRAGAQESVVASQVLEPLRKVMYACALSLTAAAASVVGKLDQPWVTVLWSLGAASATCIFLVLIWANYGRVGGRR